MRPGIQKNESDSSPGPSLDGSFRKPGSASVRTTSSTSSKFVPTSKRVYKVLKEYSTKLVDLSIFTEYLEDWVRNNLYGKTRNGDQHFSSPFSIDDLRTFDYALEGVLFQQLLRMPYPPYNSDNLKEDEFLALEDFLHTAAEGLWHAFWHKNKPLPYFVSCPRYPGSKFYTIEKAISRGRLKGLCGAALMSKNKGHLHARWDDVVNFVLFKKNIVEQEEEFGISPSVICETIFYAIHILFSRSLSKYNNVATDYVFVSFMDSKFGGVVKLGGDLGKLEVDLSNPYQSMAEWIACHAEVSISHVDRIWNKLGNVNWGDLGTLQILLAMFYSIVQWNGPPRKSMASLAANHSLRLQQRRMETRVVENEIELVPYQNGSDYNGEIVELGYENNPSSKRNGSRLNLRPGEILLLEDQNQGLKSFQIQDFLDDGNGCSYIAVNAESQVELLNFNTRDYYVILFKCKWFDTNPAKRNVEQYKNSISICIKDTWYENDPFIIASQAEQVFDVDDLYKGKDWKVVEHFRHRHIWDLPTEHIEDVVVVDEITGGNFELFVELPDIETMTWNQSNVRPDVVTSDIEAILNDQYNVEDDFINDEEDATLDEYLEDDNESTDNDDDVNDVGMKNIESDSE